MGYRELIDALRRAGEEELQAIWQEAETEAERIRAAAVKNIEEMKEKYSRMQSSAVKQETEAVVSEAGKKASNIRLLSEKKLSDRLYQLAIGFLHILRGERYKDVFGILVRELPSYKWEIVRVNPEDENIARQYFPDSEIIHDSSIAGGLEVMTRDGKIHISNTFKKRLERAWQEMLPGLIRDVYGAASED